MKKFLFSLILVSVCSAFFIPKPGEASALSKSLSGRILLNVEGHGEAWYVNPADNKRYYLGRPEDAFRLMRQLSLGIKNEHLAKIPTCDRDKSFSPLPGQTQVAGVKIKASAEAVATSTAENSLKAKNASGQTETQVASTTPAEAIDLGLTRQLAGKILLQVEGNGEAWYINPNDNKKYYLGRPADAFRIMRELSLGISREDLAKIHKPGVDEAINSYSQYEHKKITTASNKTFTMDLITIDLTNPKLKIVTDTANENNCKTNCPAKSLGSYVITSEAFAGINGSYFCDSGGCGYNSTFYPTYNTRLGLMINEDQLKYWTTGPIFAFDTNNKFYYFKDSREFKSVADFEKNYGVKLQAAIGNKPRMIQDYMNYLIDWELDKKQLNNRSVHNALGYKDNKVYLAAVYNATIAEVTEVMQSLGMQYALNLDGGGSTALWYNDEYILGPGRDVPNAILFKEE